ncbi:MAG: nucleotidyltransferase domain-containing protein [Candidatus Obscuribacterales bacterium]|nr:nucleotidyltransferase domain-containing protein [Cyanobacteria bacterium SZAS LIN-5]RTL41418.1 MAG: nucleotidyltransferase domain-containing protein [Candidatus Melainabacteria bacterium]
MTERPNPHLILPAGTQIVTLVSISERKPYPERSAGVVGKIIKSPTDNEHAYQIQLPDGQQVSLKRHEMAIRKQVQGAAFDLPADAIADRNLYEFVIYKCIVGSNAFGLSGESSDVDLRGIYLPPADMQWSLYGLPEQIEKTESDEVYWELQKFLTLSLKANPNVLECLYTPLIEKTTPLADELLAGRSKFLSKLVYQTYNGYVMSQFKKLEQDIRTTGELKWKHVMHLLRLLISGITILEEHMVPVDVGNYRERLLAVRQKRMSWEDANKWRLELHKRFDKAFEETSLPDRPDYEWANSFLIKARRQMI